MSQLIFILTSFAGRNGMDGIPGTDGIPGMKHSSCRFFCNYFGLLFFHCKAISNYLDEVAIKLVKFCFELSEIVEILE
jgi:hypothetical protein